MHFLAPLIGTIGLLLDICGAYLIFRHGIPPQPDRSALDHLLLSSVPDEDRRRRIAEHDRKARYGLRLLITGFIFQAIAIWIAWLTP
jgi:hypothetical protein